MIRFILVAATVVLFLIFSIPVLIVLNLIGRKNRQLRDEKSIAAVRWIFKMILSLAGVKITVIGKEKNPTKSGRFICGKP